MMKKVCLDNQILGWGIARSGVANPRDKEVQAIKFFDELSKNNFIIIIPTIVLSEFLAPIDPRDHDDYILLLSEYAQFSTFDIDSSKILAKILYEKYDALKEIQTIGKIPKQKLKVDVQIVATALANECDEIYSEDEEIPKIAEGYIASKKMIDLIPEQEQLFEDSE